jgi:hypothetical protein
MFDPTLSDLGKRYGPATTSPSPPIFSPPTIHGFSPLSEFTSALGVLGGGPERGNRHSASFALDRFLRPAPNPQNAHAPLPALPAGKLRGEYKPFRRVFDSLPDDYVPHPARVERVKRNAQRVPLPGPGEWIEPRPRPRIALTAAAVVAAERAMVPLSGRAPEVWSDADTDSAVSEAASSRSARTGKSVEGEDAWGSSVGDGECRMMVRAEVPRRAEEAEDGWTLPSIREIMGDVPKVPSWWK